MEQHKNLERLGIVTPQKSVKSLSMYLFILLYINFMLYFRRLSSTDKRFKSKPMHLLLEQTNNKIDVGLN